MMRRPPLPPPLRQSNYHRHFPSVVSVNKKSVSVGVRVRLPPPPVTLIETDRLQRRARFDFTLTHHRLLFSSRRMSSKRKSQPTRILEEFSNGSEGGGGGGGASCLFPSAADTPPPLMLSRPASEPGNAASPSTASAAAAASQHIANIFNSLALKRQNAEAATASPADRRDECQPRWQLIYETKSEAFFVYVFMMLRRANLML